MKKNSTTKERSYGFLTTKSFLVEVKSTNPKSAMKKAELKLEKTQQKVKKKGIDFGKVTCSYVTYGRYGIAPVGVYKQVKK